MMHSLSSTVTCEARKSEVGFLYPHHIRCDLGSTLSSWVWFINSFSNGTVLRLAIIYVSTANTIDTPIVVPSPNEIPCRKLFPINSRGVGYTRSTARINLSSCDHFSGFRAFILLVYKIFSTIPIYYFRDPRLPPS